MRLEPAGALARRVAELVPASAHGGRLVIASEAASLEDGATTVVCETDPRKLPLQLLGYIDREGTRIVAPLTEACGLSRPLFVIAIPKAGTHLLLELVRALGYRDGFTPPDRPEAGFWYYVEYSNAHTGAADFFVDSVRRRPHGNRLHPFMRTPALFIYRNPYDIVVSEAGYYHEPGNSPFAGYLAGMTAEERLLRLIDDPWLLGTLRDRVGRFVPWLSFGNVIPLSFEELVGAAGLGSDRVQRQLIWSLLLKLQIPGDPAAIGKRIFNPKSPTFREGTIGAYRSALSAAAWAALERLPKDYLYEFGYSPRAGDAAPAMPRRADEFRRRPLELWRVDPGNTPVLMKRNYLGYNLVAYKRQFVALPIAAGAVDAASLGERALAAFPRAASLDELQAKVIAVLLAAGGAREAGGPAPSPYAGPSKWRGRSLPLGTRLAVAWLRVRARLRAGLDRLKRA